MKSKSLLKLIGTVCLVLTLSVFSFVTARPGAAASSSPLDRLYEAARLEGKVYFHSPLKDEVITEIIKLFNKRYPGIEVSYTNKPGADTVNQVVTESRAGRVTVDVGECGTYQPGPLIERNLVESPKWEEWGVSADRILVNGRLVLYYSMGQGIAYNTNMLKPNEIPRNWEDLLDPRWKGGKLLIDSRGQFGRVFTHADKERGLRIARGVKAQEPIFVTRMAAALDQLAAGQAPLATVVLPTFLYLKEEKGAPMDLTPISPTSVSISGLFVPKGAPHPNAAKLLATWLTAPVAQKELDRLGAYGPLTPCEASRQARLLCDKKVKSIGGKTLEEALAEEKYREDFQKALGTSN